MNTSELLVLLFVFLVGYMLFKRCGCTEGMNNEITIPMTGNKCVIDDSISEYIDVNKIKVHNDGKFVTPEQCKEINSLQPGKWRGEGKTPLDKCAYFGGSMDSFDFKDITNTTTCENICSDHNGTWKIDSRWKNAHCTK